MEEIYLGVCVVSMFCGGLCREGGVLFWVVVWVFFFFPFILWFFGIFCFGGGKNLKAIFSVLQALVVFLSTSKALEYLANCFLQKHPHKESAEINQKHWCQPWTNNCVSW